MSNRRSFLRDIALGIAATLVPKILQPVLPEVVQKEMVEVRILVRGVRIHNDGTIEWLPDSYITIKRERTPFFLYENNSSKYQA